MKSIGKLLLPLFAALWAIGALNNPLRAQMQGSASTMIENSLSAVVTVAVFKDDVTKKLLGFRGNTDAAYEKQLDLTGAVSTGSGFVILQGNKKYVVTNAHVVENAKEEEKSIYVYSIDQTRYEVKVLGGDSFYDFAILEFTDSPGTELTSLAFAPIDARLGEKVYAIGNPLGEYPYSVSDGIISALNRVRNGITGKFGFLQSTATVIWGNSGGPLINEKGQVVGINSQIAFAEDADLWQPQINFALESAICKRLTNDIFANKGRIIRAYLGLEVSETYEELEDSVTGYYRWMVRDRFPVINQVFEQTPAFEALQNAKGSYITRVNGKLVRNIEELLGEFEKLKPGKPVSLTLLSKDGVDTASATFIPEELTDVRLAELPKYTLAKDPSFTFSEKDKQLVLHFKPEEPVEPVSEEVRSADEDDNDDNPVEPLPESPPLDYRVLGLGAMKGFGRQPDIFRIETLSDLGAALRLYGLYGECDLFLKPVLTDDPDDYSDVATSRYYMSEDPWTVRKVLWY
jgi:S1-C subfamily serine protease